MTFRRLSDDQVDQLTAALTKGGPDAGRRGRGIGHHAHTFPSAPLIKCFLYAKFAERKHLDGGLS